MVRIIFIVLIHVFGDYFLQGGKLTKLKATNLWYLLEHVGIYTLLFIIVSPLLLGLSFFDGLFFALFNGFLHFIIDYFTAKLKRKYHSVNENIYTLVVFIDHALHIAILIASYIMLFPEAYHERLD